MHFAIIRCISACFLQCVLTDLFALKWPSYEALSRFGFKLFGVEMKYCNSCVLHHSLTTTLPKLANFPRPNKPHKSYHIFQHIYFTRLRIHISQISHTQSAQSAQQQWDQLQCVLLRALSHADAFAVVENRKFEWTLTCWWHAHQYAYRARVGASRSTSACTCPPYHASRTIGWNRRTRQL